MSEAVIVSGARTAMGKGRKGSLRLVRPDDLAATVIRETVRRAGDAVRPEEIDDVLLGCAMPEGEQGDERRSHRDARRRTSGEHVCGDDQQVLLVGTADDRDGGGRHPRGPGRCRHRGRSRV